MIGPKNRGLSSWGLLLGASLGCFLSALRADALPLSLISAEDCAVELPAAGCFVAKPRIEEVVLSPSGDHLAYLQLESDGSSVWVWNLLTNQRTKKLTSRLIESLYWSTDGSGLYFEAADRLAWMPLERQRPVWIHHSDESLEQSYWGVDPVLPRHFLMTEKTEGGLYRLMRIDVDGQVEELLRRPNPLASLVLDELGKVAFVKGSEGLEQVIYRQVEGLWMEVLRCNAIDSCLPLSSDGETLWVRGRLDGDLWRLWAIDLNDGSLASVHGDPEGLADLRGVWIDPKSRQPIAVDYNSDRLRTYPLNQEISSHLKHLQADRHWSELAIEPRLEGPFWLLRESASQWQHPKYYLYDTAKRAVRPIFQREREAGIRLPASSLVTKEFFSYRASDGMMLHGFLSLPEGVTSSEIPIVAQIHGGPWNHVRPGFSALTQFLVSRGYGVFEPNFRASTGYGYSYLRAGTGEFGNGKVQQDILDGLRHLEKAGIGESGRAAIIGHSFGGFSTLSALAFVPEVFRAGIASAPPIDLVRAMRDLDERHLMPNGISQKEAVRELLLDFEDPVAVSDLRGKSPEGNLEKTSKPLLILAGGQDEKIAVADVKHYALALRKLGKDVSLLIDDEIGHSFAEKQIREAYFYLAERFLARHLGGQVGPVPESELEDYLAANLRMTGASLKEALEAPY